MPNIPNRRSLELEGGKWMLRDITEKDIQRAIRAFGIEVKARSTARQEYVIARLRKEIARVRPFTERLLRGEING